MRYAGIYSFEISTINTWLYKEGGRKNEKIMFGNNNYPNISKPHT